MNNSNKHWNKRYYERKELLKGLLVKKENFSIFLGP